jgi:zinc transport system substrate-binding protein
MMRQYLNMMGLAVLVVASLMGAVACDGGAPEPDDEGKLTVVTTIYPMQYFASRIAGGDAVVRSLVGPGTEAHAFEPTTADVQRLAGADLVIANGLALEPWLGRVLTALGDDGPTRVVETAALDDSGDPDARDVDPHVWLDPVLAMAQVARVQAAFEALDPAHAADYRTRASDLLADLEALDEAFTSGLASCAQESFVTTHAAYGYLAERYGLEQVAIAGLTPEAQPSARELAALTERVTAIGLGYVLVEPTLSSRLAQTVAAESGLELLPIHQLESATSEELAEHGDYLGLMRANLASLQVALECAA